MPQFEEDKLIYVFVHCERRLPAYHLALEVFFFQDLIFAGKLGFNSVERPIEATSYSLSCFLQNEEQIPEYSHKIRKKKPR